MFISVKPEFVEKIFNGKKTIELRKSMPKVIPGDLVIIYSSSPVMAVIGICYVKEVIAMKPLKLWNLYSDKLGIDKRRFLDYYKDKEIAIGIVLKEKEKLSDPIPLSVLRRKFSAFRPPQTFRYLDLNYFERSFLK